MITTACNELLTQLDEGLILDAANNRVFKIFDRSNTKPRRVNIADLLRENETDIELCKWIRSANLRAETYSAQGNIILQRVE